MNSASSLLLKHLVSFHTNGPIPKAKMTDSEKEAQVCEQIAAAILDGLEKITDDALRDRLRADVALLYSRASVLDLSEKRQRAVDKAHAEVFQRGRKAFTEQRYDEAASYFDLAAELKPDSGGAFVNQAYALINAGKKEEAIKPFEIAIERGEDKPESYLYLSDLYLRNDRGTDAAALLEKARAQYPQNTEIQSQLLNAYVTSGQMDRAMETYWEAVESDPSNKTYRYNLGSLLLQAERYEEAIKHLQEAVRIDPEYASAQYNLGAAYINQAVDVNERVQVLDQGLNDSLYAGHVSQEEIAEAELRMKALANERLSYFEQAVVPLERAWELTEAEGGDTQEICRALFSAYVQTGQQEKALSVSECAGYEDMGDAETSERRPA